MPSINAIFDEAFYLTTYPDVAEAIVDGSFNGTALDHYVNIGQFEGRVPRQLFSEIYVFGDSFSDNGNMFDLSGGIFPDFPGDEGRFTDGVTWIETVISQLGSPLNSDNNFALGGATTGTFNVLDGHPDAPAELVPFPGTHNQIDDLLAMNPVADPHALYMVWAGGNDVVGLQLTDVSDAIANVEVAINRLVEAGARNVMVPNLFDFGTIPLALSGSPRDQQRLAQATRDFNDELAISLQQIEDNSNVNIIPVDMFAQHRQALENPGAAGFTNVTEDFLTVNGGPNGGNPDEFMYWNPIHPTTVTHNLFAEQALLDTANLIEVSEIVEAQAVPEVSPSFLVHGFLLLLLFCQRNIKWKKKC